MSVYMAEINIAINGVIFDKNRVLTGIKELEKLISLGCFEAGSLLYSIGNGWLALGEYEKARDIYSSALNELDRPELSDISAQCYKNMGAVMEYLSRDASSTFGRNIWRSVSENTWHACGSNDFLCFKSVFIKGYRVLFVLMGYIFIHFSQLLLYIRR